MLPKRDKLIAFTADLLDDERFEDLDLEDFATRIVDGLLGLLDNEMQDAQPSWHEGDAFKSRITGKVYFIGKIVDDEAWITGDSMKLGGFVNLKSSWLAATEPSPDRRRKDTHLPRPGSPGNNHDGWKVGETVKLHHGRDTYEIIATGDKGVLLKEQYFGDLRPESNENLEKYYERIGQ